MRVSIISAAESDVAAATPWYLDHAADPTVANRFADAFEAAAAELERRPFESLTPYPDTAYRYLRVDRFPYLIVVKERGRGEAVIIAVPHERQSPDGWVGRGGA